MSNQTKTYRYPGTRPFTKDDASLFFGRDEDIENLSQFIKLEKQIVLYGKSGLGKTSLLNAGIIPKLKQDDFIVNTVRFRAYTTEKESSPTDILRQVLTENTNYDNFLWTKLLQFSPENLKTTIKQELNILENLWYYCKSTQIEQSKQETILLVFDQFEELFTYPENQIDEFKKSFSELLNVRITQYIRNIIKEKGKEFLSRDEIQLLYKNLDVKVIFSIRSDRMSYLNKLKDYFPEILQKTYELEPLSIEQAEKAIIKPSQSDKQEFISPIFSYSDNVLNTILAFLSKQNSQKIETFQLQIVCQYIENIIIEKNIITIQTEHIERIDSVYKNFYDNLIAKLPNKEQYKAQIFIEEGLIFEEDERRLTLYEGQIVKSYGISHATLRQLVNTHLLRTEPNPSGGYIYELSHDTLVVPILESKRKRVLIKNNELEINSLMQSLQIYKKDMKIKKMKIKNTLFIWIIMSIIIPLMYYIPEKLFNIDVLPFGYWTITLLIMYSGMFVHLLIYWIIILNKNKGIKKYTQDMETKIEILRKSNLPN